MNAILSGSGKIAFQLLLVVLFRLTTITCQLNLYDTDRANGGDSLQYDCLNYYGYREKSAYQDLLDVTVDVIPYCIRPINDFDKTLDISVNPLSQRLNFEEIRLVDITAQQLLSWSVPIEVAERYQLYLNELNPGLNESFYNCTKPWFGLRCQYSFGFNQEMPFNQIIESTFHGRISYSESSDMMIQIPCYILLECHRHGRFWCLDWREVCDGNVDCFDEGLDEESCFDMEINECSENEYRCHNGLCIADELWEGGEGEADCLDRSDEISDASYTKSCFQDPTFRCEEHTCRARGKSFPCGDGECVKKLDHCYNGRHVLLIDSIISKGNLTEKCWIAMVCITGLVNQVNGKLCIIWLMNNSAYEFLAQCNPFFQFPSIPVHSDHIRFFYKNVSLRPNLNQFLLPDYICYNQQLCDFIPAILVHENLTCLSKLNSIIGWHDSINSWILIMILIEQHFRSCVVSNVIFQKKTEYSDHPLLYNCQNSLKFISKHRIMDRIYDCFGSDDETDPNSCLLNQRHRVKCSNATECWSPLLKIDACSLSYEQSQEEIPFLAFCDGIVNHFYHDYNRQRHTEEDGCQMHWLCDNLYARCDGYPACSDGRDEDNCSRTVCPLRSHACVSPINYTVICLNFTSVNDKIDDCLGASDEQYYCRSVYPWREISHRFRCTNDSVCLQSSQLCNNKVDCLLSDDDEDFCKDQQFTCNKDSAHNRSQIEEVLCGLSEDDSHRIKYFSIITSSNYPLLDKNVADETSHWPAEQRSGMNDDASPVQSNLSSYYCNRGVAMETWMENSSLHTPCICPPSYYGDLCQYQNQRISLTLRLSSNARHATYAIVSMLIDDNDKRQEIIASNQFIYIAKESCSIKLNQYLLFSTRPKNISKNYSARIDIFEKNRITYVGSWHLFIPFLFLPVNRLAVSLNLSNYLIQTSFKCPITCYNGSECIKYLNKDKYFCRCPAQWSGIQCDIPVNCETCSPDSICIGSTNNRSICVCPLHKFGPRCLLTSTCPINACQNNGQCIPADVSIPDSNYTCICLDQYFGRFCQDRKPTLIVSLNNIYVPAYLVAYFFTVSNKSEPIKTIILRKLTLFQHIVTFHITVPFHLVFIQTNDKFYLAALQQSPKVDISTSISSTEECFGVGQLLNSTILKMIPYQRIIYFHDLCRTHSDLICFIDEAYLCLCTNDHHANCLKFNRDGNFQCSSNDYCANQGKCLQDHPSCPSTKICICPSCFFGNQCQFYAKGLGSTLDEILGYEFKRNQNLSEQPFTVKVSAAITMIIFVIGIINGILSIMTFNRTKSKEVGCGIYLLCSSATSLLTVTTFTLKFWLLFLSHQNRFKTQSMLNANCRGIELLLKLFLYMDNWFNACVAIERTYSVYVGVQFDKIKSKKIAKHVIVVLLIINCAILIPQMISLHVFEDKMEERSWCVVTYSSWLNTYTSATILFHYFAPLCINICSTIFIILITTLQRAASQTHLSVWFHLKSKIKQHKQLVISPMIIVILTVPHLIISMILDCNKSSHLFWFYLTGYFLSFIPAAFIFIIFVLPSPLYKKEFKELMLHIRRRL